MLSIAEYECLLWVAVDLLQVMWQAGCWGRDQTGWQQVSLLQQVHHSQGLWGAGLEAHGCQRRAQLGRPWAARWLREGETTSCSADRFTKKYDALIDWR